MDSDDEEIMAFLFLCWHWLLLVSTMNGGIRDLNSALTGHEYTQELLHGSSTQCLEMMRMSRDAYVLLCNHFNQRNWLQSSRSITFQEKMAMFFIVIGHNERMRMVKRRFQHSTETIHRCFHEVLNAMMNFAREVIVPTSSNPFAYASDRHRRLKQIFPGAIGALDGTLVHAVVPNDQQARYRGRGKDKYYLCDVAYTNTRGFMAPYRNTRYWLADFRRQRALTKEEKFNHAHTQLRNVIERAYGVLKARFPVLKQMAPYPFPIQRDIVIACFAIHNFIRKWNIHDQLFMEYDEETLFAGSQDEETHSQFVHDMEWGSHSMEEMAILRDEIATQLMSNN
ncbi:hypothetical protein SSX86_023860 [Deinandra increscens subsp. villosa]|uniref:DDE Tnp4 domain-containing protein n=1 Tax=Deinandra increscens subsp. villosa TaxID=3103831 RepID=A0AAP0CNE3_9ASTR